jgi:hypothetical protein
MAMDHDFWLFREGERAYTEYHDLLPRRDAPVSIHDDVLQYFFDTLTWIPTLNPAKGVYGHGLNMWGPTVIDRTGGALFRQVLAAWAQLFACGPERLRLHGPATWHWPFDEEEHLIHEDEVHALADYTYFNHAPTGHPYGSWSISVIILHSFT